MADLSEARLREYARDDNIELRVGRDDNDQPHIVTREGTWGGRLVRNLTSMFGTPKTGGYMDAKSEVLKALQDMYGKEIGTKVFQANIGSTQNGVHVSSKAHPITGRHIRLMLEQGDREMLRKYRRPENGGVSFGSTGLKTPEGEDAPSERCTEDWMLRKSAGMSGPSREDPPHLGQSFDRRGMDLRAHLVGPGGDRPVLRGRPIAQLLEDDIAQRLEEEPHNGSPSWTLDIGLPNGNGHQIGLRVDPGNPGKVNVFDSRRGEYSVVREDLGTWLDAHLRKNYSVEGLQLYRAQPWAPSPLPRLRDKFTEIAERGKSALTEGATEDQIRLNNRHTTDRLAESIRKFAGKVVLDDVLEKKIQLPGEDTPMSLSDRHKNGGPAVSRELLDELCRLTDVALQDDSEARREFGEVVLEDILLRRPLDNTMIEDIRKEDPGDGDLGRRSENRQKLLGGIPDGFFSEVGSLMEETDGHPFWQRDDRTVAEFVEFQLSQPILQSQFERFKEEREQMLQEPMSRVELYVQANRIAGEFADLTREYREKILPSLDESIVFRLEIDELRKNDGGLSGVSSEVRTRLDTKAQELLYCAEELQKLGKYLRRESIEGVDKAIHAILEAAKDMKALCEEYRLESGLSVR